MSDPLLFAFGCGVMFLVFAGAYVWLRSRYQPVRELGVPDNDPLTAS